MPKASSRTSRARPQHSSLASVVSDLGNSRSAVLVARDLEHEVLRPLLAQQRVEVALDELGQHVLRQAGSRFIERLRELLTRIGRGLQ